MGVLGVAERMSGRGWLWPVLVGMLLAGCSRTETPTAPTPASRPAAESPRAVIERLMALRAARRYTELAELVVPSRAQEVVSTLVAMDTFLDSNGRLCLWVREHVGMGLAQRTDLAYLGSNLGIFSPHIELLDEVVRGDASELGYMVDGRLPVEQAHLCLLHGTWRYDPGEGYSEDLLAGFRLMAQGLDGVLADLEAGRISPDELRNTPDKLVERVQRSLAPGVALISRARQEKAGAAGG